MVFKQPLPKQGCFLFPPAMDKHICGVDKDLIERFLILIRDNYKKADKATFFLELRAGVSNVPGIANSRDVLSHLVTALDSNISEAERLEQLTNAAEHMRRAIVEPYEVALKTRLDQTQTTYEKIVSQVLPVIDEHPTLQNAPNGVSVRASLKQISQLFAQGRASKTGNIWNQEWEEGISNFIDAFDQLERLESTLLDCCHKYDAIVSERENKKATRQGINLGLWGLIVGIIGVVFAVIAVMYPPVGEAIRKFLGLP